MHTPDSQSLEQAPHTPPAEEAQTLCFEFLSLPEVCTTKTKKFATTTLELLQKQLGRIQAFIDGIQNTDARASVLNIFMEGIQRYSIDPDTPASMLAYYIRKEWKKLPLALKSLKSSQYEKDIAEREGKQYRPIRVGGGKQLKPKALDYGEGPYGEEWMGRHRADEDSKE